MTDTMTEAKTCRLSGCDRPGVLVKLISHDDQPGMLDRAWLCADHKGKKVKEVLERLDDSYELVPVASVQPATEPREAPPTRTAIAQLDIGQEDVVALGLAKDPVTLRAFRCPDGEWEAFLAACAALGAKPHEILRSRMDDYVSAAASRGEPDVPDHG